MSVNDDLDRANRNSPSWEEIRTAMIIERLKSGNPEPVIKFMREGGDMRQLGDYGLGMIAAVLRGEKLQGKGRPKNEQIRNRNIALLCEIAQAEIEEFPLTNPKYSEITAFKKAVDAIGGGISERTAKNLWDDCDKDYYRKAMRDLSH